MRSNRRFFMCGCHAAQMSVILGFLAAVITSGVWQQIVPAMAIGETWQSGCHGIQFGATVDQTKRNYVCGVLDQLPPIYRGTVRRVNRTSANVQIEPGIMVAAQFWLNGTITFFQEADYLDPEGLLRIVIHEASHGLRLKLERQHPGLIQQFDQAWSQEGGMEGAYVVPGYASTDSSEGFAVAATFVSLKDSTANRYPQQQAVILKILRLGGQ